MLPFRIAFHPLDRAGQNEIDTLDRSGSVLRKHSAQGARVPFSADEQRLPSSHDLPAADTDDQERRPETRYWLPYRKAQSKRREGRKLVFP